MYRLYLGSACINEIRWHDPGFATVHRVNDTGHLPRPGPPSGAAGASAC